MVGFVPQDDIVLPDLTVRENILHSARIRLGGAWSDHELQDHVDTLISYLGLDSVSSQLTGDTANKHISGGERKRLNVAIELAAAPRILVLDEPTSGLDASAALSLIGLLKALTQQSVTVVCVVHQPRAEIFAQLDDLLLLDRGKQIYYGKAADAQRHISGSDEALPGNYNPADVILDLISSSSKDHTSGEGQKPIVNFSSYQQCIEDDTSPLIESIKKRKAPWFYQVYLNFKRGIRQQTRQLASLSLEITSGTITGLLIGLSNYEFEGHLFQGIFHAPFEPLSSSVNYRLLSEQGMLCCLAMGTDIPPYFESFTYSLI